MNLKAHGLSSDFISDEDIKANPGRVVELLGCPFCAGSPRVLEQQSFFTIGCSNPKCVVTTSASGTNLEVLTRTWNTRLGRKGGTVRVRVEDAE